MELVRQLDDYGKPAWIAAMILGFVAFWPIGLAILGYLIWSGRMGCGQHRKRQHWVDWCGRQTERTDTWRAAPSGNAAFDEYRADTLKRLEDEFEDFQAFLEQLRMAKDKQEFDAFMASRKTADDSPEATA
jgi:hypothetical protein